MSWIDQTVPAFFPRFFLVEHIYVKEDSWCLYHREILKCLLGSSKKVLTRKMVFFNVSKRRKTEVSWFQPTVMSSDLSLWGWSTYTYVSLTPKNGANRLWVGWEPYGGSAQTMVLAIDCRPGGGPLSTVVHQGGKAWARQLYIRISPNLARCLSYGKHWNPLH